jgi:hypothetical protein
MVALRKNRAAAGGGKRPRRARQTAAAKISLGGTNWGRKLVLTLALTFYPLPRGEEITIGRCWFCERRSGQSSRGVFKATAHVSPSPWGEGRDEGGRETNYFSTERELSQLAAGAITGDGWDDFNVGMSGDVLRIGTIRASGKAAWWSSAKTHLPLPNAVWDASRRHKKRIPFDIPRALLFF